MKPEQVLGRISEIQFDEAIHAEVHQKTILVTGAGGSIGSEICRQILRYQPAKLVILELSEFALYCLEQELSSFLGERDFQIDIVHKLGSVTDEIILDSIFEEHMIDIVYHAAAYKHVPIVEDNVIAGIIITYCTKLVADFAHRFGVVGVLISTDKAVRPTNIMGASKRLAELVPKTAKKVKPYLRWSDLVMLGSSGSVIPKFKSQLMGGPITVTHEK